MRALDCCKLAIKGRMRISVLFSRKFSQASPLTTIPSPPYKVLFFGTDDFAATCLQKIHGQAAVTSSLQVVCLPSRKPCSVARYAHTNSLPLHVWGSMDEGIWSEFDIGVVVSFGRLIPARVIKRFPLGMYNVHGSLLPDYRGAAPIMRAIENGDSHTGVTVLQIAPHRFDSGDVLTRSAPVVIDDVINARDLTRQLATVGADLLASTLGELPRRVAEARAQEEATDEARRRAGKLTLADTRLDLAEMSCAQVWRKYRAFGFDRKHALRCRLDGELVRLYELVQPTQADLAAPTTPGRVEYDKRSRLLVIGCREGAIRCSKLCLSKRPVSALDFNNGQLQWRRKKGVHAVFEPIAD